MKRDIKHSRLFFYRITKHKRGRLERKRIANNYVAYILLQVDVTIIRSLILIFFVLGPPPPPSRPLLGGKEYSSLVSVQFIVTNSHRSPYSQSPPILLSHGNQATPEVRGSKSSKFAGVRVIAAGRREGRCPVAADASPPAIHEKTEYT